MSGEPMQLKFDGLSQPVRLVDCDALYEHLPLAFPGWRISVEPTNGQSPILTVTQEKNSYKLEGFWFSEPLLRNDMVDAICALVAELIRAYVRQDDRLLCLHGAAAEFAGKLVIFPSQYRAGKSILSACLAAAGARLFCDDVLPIGLAAANGIAPGLAVRLRKPLPDNLSAESRRYIEKHNCLQGEHYLYLDLADSAMAARGQQAPVGAFVLLEREAGATPVFEEISEAEVLRQVVWQNFAREAEAPKILEVLSRLVADSQRLRLRYDRAEDAVGLLRQYFSSWPEKPSSVGDKRVVAEHSKAVAVEIPPGCYWRNPGVSVVEVDGQSFLADSQGAAIHHLNPTANSIWNLLSEPMSVDEIMQILLSAFPDLDPDRLSQDVNSLVADLMRETCCDTVAIKASKPGLFLRPGYRQYHQLRNFDMRWLRDGVGDRVGDILRLQAGVEAVIKRLCLPGIAQPLRGEAAAYQSRYDFCNSNPLAGIVEPQGFTETMYRVLAGDVGRAGCVGFQAGNRTQVDNMTVTAFEHAANQRVGYPDHTLHVGFDDLAPLIGAAHIESASPPGVVSGIVDQDVDLIETGG